MMHKDITHREVILKRRRRQENEGAQGMVEFALVLPLLLLLIFGVIEFGRLLFLYASVVSSSREAARYGSAVGDNGGGTPRYKDCAGIENAALRLGRFANVTDVTIYYDSGPGTPIIGYCNASINIKEEGKRINIDVQADYQPIVPLINLKPFTFNSKSSRTIFTDIRMSGTVPPTPTAVPPGNFIHLGALTGSSSCVANCKNHWKATASVTIHDAEHKNVKDATVTGNWSGGFSGPGSCTTVGNGKCDITTGNIPVSNASVTFTVTNVVHDTRVYQPSANDVSVSVEILKP